MKLLTENEALEGLLTAHLQEIDMALAAQAAVTMGAQVAGNAQVNVGTQGQGAGRAMANSNAESGGAQNATNHAGKQQQAA